MELQPTKTEARIFLASLVRFWAIGGGISVYFSRVSYLAVTLSPGEPAPPPSPLFFVAFFVAFACGIGIFGTLFRVGARELGRPASEFLFPTRIRTGLDGWRIILKCLDPRWYARVIRTTGWNRYVAGVLLLASFAWVVVASVLMTTATFPSRAK